MPGPNEAGKQGTPLHGDELSPRFPADSETPCGRKIPPPLNPGDYIVSSPLPHRSLEAESGLTPCLVFAAPSDHDWQRFESRWQVLRDKPEPIRQAEALSDLGEEYSKVKIEFRAPEGTRRAPVVRVKEFNVRTGKWEPVDLPRDHRRWLADIGIGVAAEDVTIPIGENLLAATPLDRLADLARVIVAPETLVPKVLGILVEGVARHAGMPGFVARWAGEAVEQAVAPAFEPDGVRGELLAGLKDFAVTCDLGHGQVTSAVADLALDRLADELKKKAGR